VFVGVFQFLVEPSEVKFLAGLLVNLLPLIYFAILYLKKPSKVGGLITIITALVSTTFLIGLGRTLFETQGISVIFVLSSLSIVGWILYLLWYSKFGNRALQELVGKNLTDLTFYNEKSEKVAIVSDQYDFHILLFHRGNWCPFCMAQVRDIANHYKKLSSRNVKVHIISPVNESWNLKLANKYDIDFDFLRDKNLSISKRLGIVDYNGIPFGFKVLGFESDTILPTVMLLGKDMKVLRVHETDDYKKRPEPEFFIRLIDSY